jgi:CBS-domain-containing membrane protein
MLFMSYNNVFAQPRNVIGGHLMSALAAIMVAQFFSPQWWSIALVVLMAALLMLVTNTIHPPGGGTAIAAYLGHYLPAQIFSTVILDCALIILAAVLINNVSPSRKYPLFWV